MNFNSVFHILVESFQKYDIDFALIGGFALHAAGHSRSTQDIDMLVLKEDMPTVKKIMLSFGYELLHESEDVSNFSGKMKELGRVDFLHAHRQYAKNMLKRATECDILDEEFRVKVIVPEDIIGLKVQASSNDPDRYHQDMADIEAVIHKNRESLNMDLIREYFALFNRENELNEIMARM